MKLALLLEDLPESQDVLREVMRAAFPGMRVHGVADVASALRIIQQFRFDLALIDLSLPDGSGTTVIEAMTACFPESVIVVATIFDDDDHLFPALRAGAHGYLLKDEAPEVLARQLQGIREGRPPLSPSVARRMLQHFYQTETARPELAVHLSPREREVLTQLARGFNVAAIAEQMGISHYTVGDHVKNIYRKLNISSRAEAALRAKNLGLL